MASAKNIYRCAQSHTCTMSLTFSLFVNCCPCNAPLSCPKIKQSNGARSQPYAWVGEKLKFQFLNHFNDHCCYMRVSVVMMQNSSICQYSWKFTVVHPSFIACDSPLQESLSLFTISLQKLHSHFHACPSLSCFFIHLVQIL